MPARWKGCRHARRNGGITNTHAAAAGCVAPRRACTARARAEPRKKYGADDCTSNRATWFQVCQSMCRKVCHCTKHARCRLREEASTNYQNRCAHWRITVLFDRHQDNDSTLRSVNCFQRPNRPNILELNPTHSGHSMNRAAVRTMGCSSIVR